MSRRLEWPLHTEVNEVVLLNLFRGTCTRAELANVLRTCRPLHEAWLHILHSGRFIEELCSWHRPVAGSGGDGVSRLLRLGARGIPDILMDMSTEDRYGREYPSRVRDQQSIGRHAQRTLKEPVLTAEVLEQVYFCNSYPPGKLGSCG